MIIELRNRKNDINEINKLTWWIEEGIRFTGLIYHDHSLDKDSYDNIMNYKKSIEYRLFSAMHGYQTFLENLIQSEKEFLKFETENHFSHVEPHPVYRIAEQKLSGNFDSIIYHISSIFDYLSHIVCYIVLKNKQKTTYWTKLARRSRDKNSELYNLNSIRAIDEVDRRFVKILYDYRSRLIHNERDIHSFEIKCNIKNEYCRIHTCVSRKLSKIYRKRISANPNHRFTLTFLISFLLRQSFKEIEFILDNVIKDIQNGSSWPINLKTKNHELNFLYMDPNTGKGSPASNIMYERFKKKRKQNLEISYSTLNQ